MHAKLRINSFLRSLLPSSGAISVCLDDVISRTGRVRCIAISTNQYVKDVDSDRAMGHDSSSPANPDTIAQSIKPVKSKLASLSMSILSVLTYLEPASQLLLSPAAVLKMLTQLLSDYFSPVKLEAINCRGTFLSTW